MSESKESERSAQHELGKAAEEEGAAIGHAGMENEGRVAQSEAKAGKTGQPSDAQKDGRG
ncbi:hypothetical protein [Pseudactinotalea sp. HY158]|uniref:hypothetical protein n=1 Tax=Pseudactinotalea sp. HY158 TaxID=2654547 RepID=UPI00129CCE94|nr:hypothetical protein [Pseudactinotalea sp. HY158]QGH68337.1 hypothetical protein GCE65_01520 [Pseudactinotalea sp. HY158]